MADDDLIKKISQALDAKLKPIHGEVARIHHDLSDLRSTYLKSSVELSRMRNDVSRIDSELEGIKETLDDPETGLERIYEQLMANTGSLVIIESKITVYDDMHQMNKDNIKKLDKRLDLLEEDAGVEVPPELKLADVS